MAGVTVDPEYLNKLATHLDDAEQEAVDAAAAVVGLTTACYMTHGVISGLSNDAFGRAEQARMSAATAIALTAHNLAAKVRAAGAVYASVDGDLAANIATQMLDK